MCFYTYAAMLAARFCCINKYFIIVISPIFVFRALGLAWYMISVVSLIPLSPRLGDNASATYYTNIGEYGQLVLSSAPVWIRPPQPFASYSPLLCIARGPGVLNRSSAPSTAPPWRDPL